MANVPSFALFFCEGFPKLVIIVDAEEGVDGLSSWSKDWQLLFNVGKCKIVMNGVKLEEVEVEKDVGVLVASNLKPSQNVVQLRVRPMVS